MTQNLVTLNFETLRQQLGERFAKGPRQTQQKSPAQAQSARAA